MHNIESFIFDYIIGPTAIIAYVVLMWSFIVWTIKTWLKERKEKDAANRKHAGE